MIENLILEKKTGNVRDVIERARTPSLGECPGSITNPLIQDEYDLKMELHSVFYAHDEQSYDKGKEVAILRLKEILFKELYLDLVQVRLRCGDLETVERLDKVLGKLL